MNGTIDALGHRLQTLMDDVHFRSDFDKAPDSPEHLMVIGAHNIREYEKIETMGAEPFERIWSLISNILASVLQEEAIEKYGNTDGGSIRQVLHNWFEQPEDREYWERLRPAFKRGLLGFNLTNEQGDAVMNGIYDKFLQLIIEMIEELIVPMHLLPRAEAQPIAITLSDIMKEESS